MLIDSIVLTEGSNIANLTIASGSAFPNFPSSGELFFRTDIENGALYIYAGGQWLKSANTANVTAASLGLGNVNNTTDLNKPVSSAVQAALNLKANTSGLATVATSGSYSDLIAKPTASSFNLGNVDNTSDINKPISSATQTALNLKANTSSLHLVATSGSYNDLNNKPSQVTLVSLGLNNVNNTADTNKPVSIAQQSALNLKANISALAAVATSGSYTDLTNTPTVTSGTLGLATVATSGNYNDLTNKPVAQTAADLGLGNVNNTSDANKPVSVDQQTALDLKANIASLHAVATSGNYVDLLNKPVITPSSLGLATVSTTGSYNDLSNKPVVTTASLGLELVDNTSDANKPVSTATQTALNLKANISSLGAVATSNDYDDLDNKPVIPVPTTYTLPIATDTLLGGIKIGSGIVIDPTGIISVDVGGGAPAYYTLPVASDTLLGGIKIGSGLTIGVDGIVSTDLSTVASSGDYADLINVPTITATTLGLGLVDNTSDANKPISAAQGSINSQKANIADLSTVATTGEYSDLLNTPAIVTVLSLGLADVATSGSYNDLADTPSHALPTLTELGIGNINNTSDLSKPVSSAQQAALDLKANISSLSTVATTGSYNDLADQPTIPSNPTASSIGLGNVNNTSDANKPVSTAQQSALDLKADIASLNAVATSGDYDDLSNKPTVAAVASSGSYLDLVDLPWTFPLSKFDVGLGGVDNTSDANKPVSTAQQTALNAKASISTDTFVQIPLVSSAPSSAPSDIQAGFVPMVYDTATDTLWIYNGAWKSAAFV